MRKTPFLMLLLATLLTATTMQAQDTMKVLLKPSKLNYLGLYVAPEFQYGQSNAEFTSFTGNSVMLMFNKKFAIGASGYSSAMQSFSPAGVSPLYLRSGFGGLRMEYTVKPNSAIHVTIPLVVGVGTARTDSLLNTSGRYRRNSLVSSAAYAVIQPGVQVEANLFRWAKVFAGANYRFASKVSTASTSLPTDVLQGFSASAGVKLGLFDFRIKRKKRDTPAEG